MSAGASAASQGPSLYHTCSAYGRTAVDYAKDTLLGPDASAGYRTTQLSHSALKRVMEMWLKQRANFRSCLEFATEFVDSFSENRVVTLIQTQLKCALNGPYLWAFPFLVKVSDQFRLSQHCTMLVITDRTCEFFDPEGRAPENIAWSDDRTLLDLAILIFKQIYPGGPFTYSAPSVACQPDKTTCGYYGLHWVKHRLDGGTTESYLDLLKELGSLSAFTVRAEVTPLVTEACYYCDTYIALSNNMGCRELKILMGAVEATTAQGKLVESDDELASLPSPSSVVIALRSQHRELTGIILWYKDTLSYFDRDWMNLKQRSAAAYQRAQDVYKILVVPPKPFEINESKPEQVSLCLVTLLFHLFVGKKDFDAFRLILRDDVQYQRLKIDAFRYVEQHSKQKDYSQPAVDSDDDF